MAFVSSSGAPWFVRNPCSLITFELSPCTSVLFQRPAYWVHRSPGCCVLAIMAYRDQPEAYEREIGIVPDIVKQYVVYLYRHIR